MRWFTGWRKRRIAKREKSGFEFAAGTLLADGWEGVDYLEALVNNAKYLNCYDEFNMGIQRALTRWKEANK